MAATTLLLASCSSGLGSFENLMDIGVCDPDTVTFSEEVDNPFFPLPVGHQIILEGNDSGADLVVRITVLDEAESIAGVRTRVVEEYEAENGRVVEISRNFFAQAEDGTVCYFGEDVDIFDSDGDVTSNAGAWRADGERSLPGIYMPGSLEVGQAFQQEIAPGVAEDQAKVIALRESTVVPAGTFDDTATLLDRNPLDGGEGTKVYARGVGLIVDESVRMTSHTMLG